MINDNNLKELIKCLVISFDILNSIRARDGAPPSIDHEYFSEVVDRIDNIVLAITGSTAHCHKALYSDGFNFESETKNLETTIEYWRLIAENKMLENTENAIAKELLKDLCTALDNAFISSWQSTHAWDKQLTAGLNFLKGLNHE